MKKILAVLLVWLIIFCMAGCFKTAPSEETVFETGQNDTTAQTDTADTTDPTFSTINPVKDHIAITSVEEKDGQLHISVTYLLESTEECEMMLGSYSESIGKHRMLDTDVFVKRGAGEYTFIVDKTALYSGKIYVNLSEYPRPSPWTPLATNTYILENFS